MATKSVGKAATGATDIPTLGQLGSGFRSRIDNGDMGVDQRNAGGAWSAAAGTNTYGLDRWFVTASGAAVICQQVAGTGAFQYALQISGAASNTGVVLGQRIAASRIYDLAGQTVTLQAMIAASTLTSITWTAYFPTAADNYASKTQIATGTFTIGSTAGLKTASFTLPSGAQNGVEILFAAGPMTSGTLKITGVGLEGGAVATPFEKLPPSIQLTICQYYFRWLPFNLGFSATAGNQIAAAPIMFPAMRVSPQPGDIVSDPNTSQTSGNNTSRSVTNITPYSAFISMLSTAAGSSQINGYRLSMSADL